MLGAFVGESSGSYSYSKYRVVKPARIVRIDISAAWEVGNANFRKKQKLVSQGDNTMSNIELCG